MPRKKTKAKNNPPDLGVSVNESVQAEEVFGKP